MGVKTNRTYVLLDNYSMHHNTELKREEANPTKTNTKQTRAHPGSLEGSALPA